MFRYITKLFFAVMLASLALVLMIPSSASAYRVEKLKELKNFGDVDLGPTLFYVNAKQGDSVTKTLQITNRSGAPDTYEIEIEDFEGSTTDSAQPTVLLGKNPGKYGAKKWFTCEKDELLLDHADRAFVDCIIKIPDNVESGDYYAAFLVHSTKKTAVEAANSPKVEVTSRVGSLFIIRVEGDILEQGNLLSFSTDKYRYDDPKVTFKTVFHNTGNVMLEPEGKITIYNMFNKQRDVLEIKPFRTLRDSIRENQTVWSQKFLFGRYKAVLALSRGYGETTDTATIYFWVLPWKLLLLALGTLIAIILIIIFIRRNVKIEFRRKH